MEKSKLVWLKTSEKEATDTAENLATKGLTNEKLGLVLRDQHGIPTLRVYGKKLSQITKIKQSDLRSLERKNERLKEHLEKNKQDKSAKRKLIILSGRINKLKKYYAR